MTQDALELLNELDEKFEKEMASPIPISMTTRQGRWDGWIEIEAVKLLARQRELLNDCKTALIWAENDNTKKLLQGAIDKAKGSS